MRHQRRVNFVIENDAIPTRVLSLDREDFFAQAFASEAYMKRTKNNCVKNTPIPPEDRYKNTSKFLA